MKNLKKETINFNLKISKTNSELIKKLNQIIEKQLVKYPQTTQ